MEVRIFDSVGSSPLGEVFGSGFIPGAGTYFCVRCGTQIALRETDQLPGCDGCGGSRFRRDSIFAGRQEHGAPTVESTLAAEPAPPDWLSEARRRLPGDRPHLVYRDDEAATASITIERGWTRIGRSRTADLRLEDPSVSRRHALVVAEPGKELRVLDDRSLNGVFVNGEAVEWGPLRDGDELAVGRYKLYLLDGRSGESGHPRA